MGFWNTASKRRTWTAAGVAVLVLLVPASGFAAAARRYQSVHPCDWLLVDSVERVLRRAGIDPDSAGVPVLATTAESEQVAQLMAGRDTPASCLLGWAGRRFR
ncbi:MAG: hypothetical protein KY467_00790 [Gemmatimonadetes bacterium]|nr:hypothetical protein [Gemmatimonadota bacterium]